ncbi:hypothetical protein CKO13_00815 [Halorhodospira neutriphila]|uniref:Uncharacterized protein n=1 Tax=Halorhodospira neutriphila TaxID=168379 RepID=A0ABS1E488_9GAMM|nr:hypothetical protein [Halorhodospira neutriphila]
MTGQERLALRFRAAFTSACIRRPQQRHRNSDWLRRQAFSTQPQCGSRTAASLPAFTAVGSRSVRWMAVAVMRSASGIIVARVLRARG